MTFKKMPEPDWWTVLYYAILVAVVLAYTLAVLRGA